MLKRETKSVKAGSIAVLAHCSHSPEPKPQLAGAVGVGAVGTQVLSPQKTAAVGVGVTEAEAEVGVEVSSDESQPTMLSTSMPTSATPIPNFIAG